MYEPFSLDSVYMWRGGDGDVRWGWRGVKACENGQKITEQAGRLPKSPTREGIWGEDGTY